jgi:hypothetical protein
LEQHVGVRLFFPATLMGVLFSTCGGAIGVFLGGGLVWLDWMPDAGGGRIFLVLVLIPAVASGIWGFVSARESLLKHRSIAALCRRLALLGMVACGGLLLKAWSILAVAGSPDRYSLIGRDNQVVTVVALLLGLALICSGVIYGVLATKVRETQPVRRN